MPAYNSKKLWTAVITLGITISAHLLGRADLAKLITILGATLIGGFAVADHGKEAARINNNRQEKKP